MSLTFESARAIFDVPEHRIEGREKVSGRARYAADVYPPGTLWARFLTSPVPHARIVSIDASAARQAPGVHAVLTGADVQGARLGRILQDWPVLAWERVRLIGDRVAAVAAESLEAAEEALGLIQVEYEELPAVLEPEEALADRAIPLHPPDEASGYRYLAGSRPPIPHPNLQGYVLVKKGDEDIEAAFARAHRVFEHTFTTPRQHQGYIEPHATVVWIDAEGIVHVASSNKSPFGLRGQVASTIGLPPERIVVEPTFIGGDFGGKGTPFDEAICYYLARATGRPVRAVMSYVDELQAANPRHAARIRLRTGVDQAGRFMAHQAEVVFNAGAYAAGKPVPSLIPGVPKVDGGLSTLAAYYVPNTRMEFKSVYTNTVPGGHMRAPGEVQVQFASESHVDMIARELGMHPLEFRLLNAVRPGQTGPGNERFREARAVEVLEALRRETRWDETRLTAGRGRGVSLGVREVHGGRSSAVLRLLPDGTVEVVTGLPDQGSGGFTMIRRVVAATLSVDPERVIVTQRSTAEATPDAGAGASRVTWIVGQTVHRGALELKTQLEELAAEVLGWPTGQVRLEGDRFVLGEGTPVPDPPPQGGRGTPSARESNSASFGDVAQRLAAGAPVEARGAFEGGMHHNEEPGDYNFVAYMAEVEVDAETGRIDVGQVVMAIDVGTIINPIGHQGQLDGGFAHGLGTALMEELRLENGKVTTLSLGEYKLPTPADMPPFRTVHVPTTVGPGPFGAKMIGEANSSSVAPAIANAVADAVGVRLMTLPTSAQRIRERL